MRGKALKLLIVHISAVERQRFEGEAVRLYPPALSLSRERARRRGIIQQSLRGRNGENRRGASGHGDQKPYKNTAPFFSGSGVLCKVDSPFSLLCLCMLLLREDIVLDFLTFISGLLCVETSDAVPWRDLLEGRVTVTAVIMCHPASWGKPAARLRIHWAWNISLQNISFLFYSAANIDNRNRT